MSLLSLLQLGQSGTRASRYGVQNAGNNVANSATPGYSRRDASISTRGGYRYQSLIVGGGARVDGARRAANDVLESRLRRSATSAAGAEVRAGILNRADAVLGTLGEDSLATSLDGLLVAFDQLATAPQDDTARREVLAAASRFAGEMNNYGAAVVTAQQDIDTEVLAEVERLNGLLDELASLTGNLGSKPVDPALLDRRDMLLSQVAEIVDIDVVIDETERPQIFLGVHGAALLSDGHALPVTTAVGANGTLDLQVTTSAGVQNITGSLGEGRLGSYVQARDADLGALRSHLDTLAFDVSAAINTVHSAGFGLDGVGGRPLFTNLGTSANAAMNLQVDGSVAGNPDAVAAATDAALVPGDNRNALALSQLRDATISQGRRAQEALTNTLVEFGTATHEATRELSSAAETYDRLAIMKEELTGVSIDEEMTRLIQYQTTYAAAAKVIQTADELLGELLSLKR